LYARPVRPVAIIGAGITGLTAAFSLARRGVPVSVYEASGRVGGVIRSSRERGYLVEWGPNTLLPTPLVATSSGTGVRWLCPRDPSAS